MGYTNYWNMADNRKREFTDEVIDGIKKIIKASSVPLSDGTGDSNTEPLIKNNRIILNGINDDAHETFSIFLNDEDTFWFCKTNRKSYDIVVKCILMLLEHYGYLKDWKFDGDTIDKEYVSAEHLYNSVFNK